MPTGEKKAKIIDLDAAFDQRVGEYFAARKNKYTEEEWEDLVPELYKQFGNTKIESLGATPNEYYSRMSNEELFDCVAARFEKGIGIDGFLRSALEEEKNRPVLLSLLEEGNEQAALAVEILGADRALYSLYLPLLTQERSQELQSKVAAILEEDADFACDDLLELYNQGLACDCVADIVSHCLVPRDEVFFLLLDEFLKSEESQAVGVAAMRLARYGDERALPYIKERAARAETSYLAFRTLRLAAEALGGGVAERDFSSDEEYLTLSRAEERQQAEREEVYAQQRKS